MAGKKRAAPAAAAVQRKVGPRSGLVKATFSIEPEQLMALQIEASKRAMETGSLRPDASAIVREALELWLAKARR